MSNGSAPRWPKYRKLVRLIERGLPSTRAAVLSGLPEAALADLRNRPASLRDLITGLSYQRPPRATGGPRPGLRTVLHPWFRAS